MTKCAGCEALEKRVSEIERALGDRSKSAPVPNKTWEEYKISVVARLAAWPKLRGEFPKHSLLFSSLYKETSKHGKSVRELLDELESAGAIASYRKRDSRALYVIAGDPYSEEAEYLKTAMGLYPARMIPVTKPTDEEIAAEQRIRARFDDGARPVRDITDLFTKPNNQNS